MIVVDTMMIINMMMMMMIIIIIKIIPIIMSRDMGLRLRCKLILRNLIDKDYERN